MRSSVMILDLMPNGNDKSKIITSLESISGGCQVSHRGVVRRRRRKSKKQLDSAIT